MNRLSLRLVRTNQKTYANLELLHLVVLDGSSVVARFDTVAGGPRHQVFRTDKASPEGSFEPLGEGFYSVDPKIHWAGEPWTTDRMFNPGLGFATLRLSNTQTHRADLEIHWDANRESKPGTAGCIGLPTKAEMIRLLGYFKDEARAPIALTVDYGLGTVDCSEIS